MWKRFKTLPVPWSSAVSQRTIDGDIFFVINLTKLLKKTVKLPVVRSGIIRKWRDCNGYERNCSNTVAVQSNID